MPEGKIGKGERAAWPWATSQRNERKRKRGMHREGQDSMICWQGRPKVVQFRLGKADMKASSMGPGRP